MMINIAGMEIFRQNQKIGALPSGNNYCNKINCNPISDKFDISPATNIISFTGNNFAYRQNANVIHYISFTGLNDPDKIQPIGIQMRVSGVQRNQTNSIDPNAKMNYRKDKNGFIIPQPNSVNKLANSDWKDGDNLKFKLKTIYKPEPLSTASLSYKNLGDIGRVPDQIFPKIQSFLNNPDYCDDIKFTLSNAIAGTTKGAPTIGLRANMLYYGKDPEKREKIEQAFNEILNDPDCKKKAMVYQPKTSPDEVLKLIFDHETEKTKDPKSAEKMTEVINNILKEIENPENKKILLVGHCKPDGDTLGCILGFKNAIELKYPDKNQKHVDCAIDDKIPGLFRHKLPGIDGGIKRALNPEREENLGDEITQLQDRPESEVVNSEIEILQDELTDMKKVKKEGNTLGLKDKYDVVVLFDVPTPQRFSGAFKRYLQDAKKVIYIDHHPHRANEWLEAKEETGIDIPKIKKDNLFWVADAVPAATQMVGILASKMLPVLNKIGNDEIKADKVFKTQDMQDKFKAFVASVVAGMSTDTGSFLRTANLLPQHMLMPAQQRPNFMPEGMSKWLMASTYSLHESIDKKWLHDEISYDIKDKKLPNLPLTARETMLKHAIKGKSTFETLGLGIVQVDYDDMFDVWSLARKTEKYESKTAETTFLDIQNAFKYSEVMNILRGDPTAHGETPVNLQASPVEKAAQQDYTSIFDEDRIAVLICQDKKKGFLDEKLNLAEQNGLRLSFRSQDGSIWAEVLALLFNGGGHGGASGGRVDLPEIDLETPLGVEINGKKVKNPAVIFEKLHENYKIINDPTKTEEEKTDELVKIKVVPDKNGLTCANLIKNIVVEIRKTQTEVKAED